MDRATNPPRTPVGIALESLGAVVMALGTLLAVPGGLVIGLGGFIMAQSPDEPPKVTHKDM